jgi:hypothetical protein
MQSRILGYIKRVWLLVFIIACLVFLVKFLYSESGRIQQPLHVGVQYLLLAGLLQAAFWLAAANIWQHIVAVTAQTRITVFGSLSQLFTVSLGKYIPGKIWGMLARGLQMRQHGITADSVIVATFFEQFLMLQASVVLSLLLFAYLSHGPLMWLALAAAVGVVVFGQPLQTLGTVIYVKLLSYWGKGGIAQKRLLMQRKDQTILLLKFVILWLLNGLVLTGLYFSFFDGSYSFELVASLILANTVGITLGFFAIFAPAGIGVREGVTSAILLNQMPLTDALLLSLLYRLWVVAIELSGGLLALWSARAMFRRKSAE